MTKPHDTYSVDTADPVARFIKDKLHLGWTEVLIISFLIYGPLEKLVLPTIGLPPVGRYAHFSGGIQTWLPDIEALLTGFVEFPFFFAYYVWSGRGIGGVFEQLGSSGAFSDAAEFKRFWTRASAWFRSPAWPLIAGSVAVGFMIVFNFYMWGAHSEVPPWFELRWLDPAKRVDKSAFAYAYNSNPLARALSIVLIGLATYALAQILIREILLLFWTGRLWRELGPTFVVHPYHPDDAGGTGAFGTHALHLSMFVLVLLLFIAMGSLLPGLREGGGAIMLWDQRLVIAWVLYVLFVGSAIRPLLLLPHDHMCAARDARVSAISRQLDGLLEQQQDAVQSPAGDLESVGKRIESLKKVRSQIIEDSPVWPFDTELRLKLGLSSVPLILLPGVKYLLNEAFDRLVKMFSTGSGAA